MLETENGTISADQVVVATGPFQSPTSRSSQNGSHRRSSRRTAPATEAVRPAQGTALVVGGGNTGYQIAKELAATHEVHLSVGSRQKPLPQRLLGRDLFWWLTKSRSSVRRSIPDSADG